MITFNKDTELEIICSYDEKRDRIDEQTKETFKAGEPVDAEIFEEFEEKGETYANIQFGDGTIALGVNKNDFKVLSE